MSPSLVHRLGRGSTRGTKARAVASRSHGLAGYDATATVHIMKLDIDRIDRIGLDSRALTVAVTLVDGSHASPQPSDRLTRPPQLGEQLSHERAKKATPPVFWQCPDHSDGTNR